MTFVVNYSTFTSQKVSSHMHCRYALNILAFLQTIVMYCIDKNPLRTGRKEWIKNEKSQQFSPNHPLQNIRRDQQINLSWFRNDQILTSAAILSNLWPEPWDVHTKWQIWKTSLISYHFIKCANTISLMLTKQIQQ